MIRKHIVESCIEFDCSGADKYELMHYFITIFFNPISSSLTISSVQVFCPFNSRLKVDADWDSMQGVGLIRRVGARRKGCVESKLSHSWKQEVARHKCVSKCMFK